MTASPLLLGNLGGEEGSSWRTHAADPRVAKAKDLWTLLFSPGAHFLGGEAIAMWPHGNGFSSKEMRAGGEEQRPEVFCFRDSGIRRMRTPAAAFFSPEIAKKEGARGHRSTSEFG